MAQTCHIGVAFYIHPSFPTQWALVLSESPVFEGPVWCSTAVETVNGWGALWEPFNWSPANFNPIAVFLGVVHIAQANLPMDRLKDVISMSNVASELDRFSVQGPGNVQYGTDIYTILALLRLCKGRNIGLPNLDQFALTFLIRGRMDDLQQQSGQGGLYPIVFLSNDDVSFGHFGF